MRNFFILLFLLLSTPIFAQPVAEKLIRQGVNLHDKGDYRGAIELYKEALKKNPNSMSAIYEMSLSYLKLDDYDNAQKYSTRIIDANFEPLLVDAYVVKSSVLAKTNKIDQSIKLLNEALERCGEEYLLYYNLGLTYFNKNDNQMALSNLRKAIEIDATHPSAILLYAYTLNDADRWVQSFYAFHFFLLLEPNTDRSKDAFNEMYDIITTKLSNNSPRLGMEDGINRKKLYDVFVGKIPLSGADPSTKYAFFAETSKTIFFILSQMQNDQQSGLLWDLFVPTYDEILGSGHFDTYCRYITVASFPQSLEWWENNKEEVDNFIEWFEVGQGMVDEEADFGDDSDL